MAPLNTGRTQHGSVLLESPRAFAFCGTQGRAKRLNSIERIDIEAEREWKQLPVDNRINKSLFLAASGFRDGIAVFGGSDHVSLTTYIVSREGEFREDLSSD